MLSGTFARGHGIRSAGACLERIVGRDKQGSSSLLRFDCGVPPLPYRLLRPVTRIPRFLERSLWIGADGEQLLIFSKRYFSRQDQLPVGDTST